MKLNLDGASCGGPGSAGCRGVFRDPFGTWLAGFSVKLGVCTLVKVELMPLLHSLKTATDQGVQESYYSHGL